MERLPMATSTVPAAPPKKSALQALARPPMVGLFAFLIVFVVQGLGHTLMVGMESIFGEEYVLQSAFVLGLAGAILLLIGMRHDDRVACNVKNTTCIRSHQLSLPQMNQSVPASCPGAKSLQAACASQQLSVPPHRQYQHQLCVTNVLRFL